MKQLPTTITVLITVAALACLGLIPLGYGSEKSELERKADAFLKVGDYERVFKLVDGFLQQHPDRPIGYTMLERVITAGSAFLKSEDRKRAIKLVDGYIQEYPANPIGRAMMVRVLASDGQTDSAFTEYYRFYKLNETTSLELLLDVVRGALNHSDKVVRAVAAETVERLEDEGAVPALINAFHEIRVPYNVNNFNLLLSITSALGAFGDKRATSALIDSLKNRDVEARMFAASALGKLGDKRAVPHLINTLNDGNDEEGHNYFQDNVVEALGELGDKRASSVLLKALKASESYSKVRAALALAKVGDGFYKEYAISALIDILNDDSNFAQGRAAKALAGLGDERGTSALIEALNNNSSISRRKPVVIPLGEKGDKRAVPYLIDILKNNYNNLKRMNAARVLGELGDKRAIPALINALTSCGYMPSNSPFYQTHVLASGLVKVSAAEALAKLDNERGVLYLRSAFNDGDDDVRGYAGVALAELGDESIAPNLVQILGGNESIELKFWVAEALVKLSQ